MDDLDLMDSIDRGGPDFTDQDALIPQSTTQDVISFAREEFSFALEGCTMCYSTDVIPFRVQFRPGASLYEQVVYAAKKAMISGQMRAGEPFPSVRVLSRELKINPNTAHKVVTHLVSAGLLETRLGIGTVVAERSAASPAERADLLESQIEELVVEARKLGISLEEATSAVARHWKRLGGYRQPTRGGEREERTKR